MLLTNEYDEQFCWGGKIVSLTTSAPANPFVVAAECHPAMVDSKDALNIKVPLIMLASKDEDVEEVKKFEANLTGDKYVETFKDQIHGSVFILSPLLPAANVCKIDLWPHDRTWRMRESRVSMNGDIRQLSSFSENTLSRNSSFLLLGGGRLKEIR